MIHIKIWENPLYVESNPHDAPRWMAECKGHLRSSDIRLHAVRMALEAADLSTGTEETAIAET